MVSLQQEGFLVAQMVKNLPAMQETQEDPLEEEMATHSGILPWRIPWTQEPGGLQSMGSQELGMTERPSAHTRSHARAHTHTHTVAETSMLLPHPQPHLSLLPIPSSSQYYLIIVIFCYYSYTNTVLSPQVCYSYISFLVHYFFLKLIVSPFLCNCP